jgi:hypothetical protein
MRFLLRRHRPAPSPGTVEAPPCDGCAGGLLHCHQTLVLHADGTAECEGYPRCGLEPPAHDHWVACTELASCSCTGSDHDGWAGLAAA